MRVFDSYGAEKVLQDSLPGPARMPNRVVLTTAPPSFAGEAAMITSPGASGSLAWPAAKRAVYVPFAVEQDVTFASAFSYHDVSTGTPNIDVGIYNDQWQRQCQINGGAGEAISTPGTAGVQNHDFDVDASLAPGLYYIGAAVDVTSAVMFRSTPGTAVLRACGVQQELLTSTPMILPNTATPINPASNYLPVIGILGTLFGGDFSFVTPTHINTFMQSGGLYNVRGLIGPGAPASASWPAQYEELYLPIHIRTTYPVSRLFWSNGSSLAGNMDIGLYNLSGNAIWRAGPTSTVGQTASDLQYVTPSSQILLPPGVYYLGLWNDNATVTNRTLAVTNVTANMGILLQTYRHAGTSAGLPATATFGTQTNALYPLAGITRTTTGF